MNKILLMLTNIFFWLIMLVLGLIFQTYLGTLRMPCSDTWSGILSFVSMFACIFSVILEVGGFRDIWKS